MRRVLIKGDEMVEIAEKITQLLLFLSVSISKQAFQQNHPNIYIMSSSGFACYAIESPAANHAFTEVNPHNALC
jgi:hypothetical protein